MSESNIDYKKLSLAVFSYRTIRPLSIWCEILQPSKCVPERHKKISFNANGTHLDICFHDGLTICVFSRVGTPVPLRCGVNGGVGTWSEYMVHGVGTLSGYIAMVEWVHGVGT